MSANSNSESCPRNKCSAGQIECRERKGENLRVQTFMASFNMAVLLLSREPSVGGGNDGVGALETVDKVWRRETVLHSTFL